MADEETQVVDNLAVWNRLAKIDKKHIKKITGKSYQGDSPKPQAIFEKMTGEFGAVGTGWGYEIVERWTQEFPDKDGVVVRIDCYSRVRLWAGEPGNKWEYIGQGKLMYWTQGGKQNINDDGWKISVTDALTKGLSVIGVAAEIHMGDFDPRHQPDEEAPAKPRSKKPARTRHTCVRTVSQAGVMLSQPSVTKIMMACKAKLRGEHEEMWPGIAKAVMAQLGFKSMKTTPESEIDAILRGIRVWQEQSKKPDDIKDFDQPTIDSNQRAGLFADTKRMFPEENPHTVLHEIIDGMGGMKSINDIPMEKLLAVRQALTVRESAKKQLPPGTDPIPDVPF